MPVTPVAPSAVPNFPSMADRATYNAKAYAWAQHMDNVYPAEMQALAVATNTNAVEAAASETAATEQAVLAAEAATAADLDRVQTGLDRVQTGSDRTAAAAAAVVATTQAGTASAAAIAADASADEAAQAAASAAAVSGIPAIGLNAAGKAMTVKQDLSGYELTAIASVYIAGNLSPYVTQVTTLTITNYDSATSYAVTATGGAVSRAAEVITYTAGATPGAYAVTVNGRNVPIVVQNAAVAAPTITAPTAGQTGLGQAPTFTTSAFASIGLADTHLNSDHEVRTAANGTGTLIASSYADAVKKTSWTMPGSLLATATSYFYRTRHRGNVLGSGGWSEVNFTTAATFGGLIGTQGGQGFGVGVCINGSLLVARGLSAMTGTSDKTHANYGNYQHSNGSIVCYVPKYFYRIGHASSSRFATYGANAHDIVGIETFASEATANAGGYALHRAFVNANIEVDGFFFDKYLASKDGTTSCKSIANADPISLTTSAGYNPSSTMTGCTGIIADAVVLARARGAGWNAASVFMQDALAMLSLAHGQAATSTTYCAWYDAAGTTNFPKGCNNGALADTNDATVTYAVSTTSPKPKTRATANFAKTTHNGQECGIADLNGSMYQALIGLTMAGTSGTDTTQNTTGTAFALKRSADFGALTGGHGGANDAWGTAASLATLFDQITGFEPWVATTGWLYLGNGANQVFSGSTSGTDYLRKCCGIPILTGANATGTSQFGNDGCYQYGVANQVPLAAGYWNDAALSGVFYRGWYLYRSVGSDNSGFRAAAY